MSDVFPVVCSYLDPKALLCSMNERYAKKPIPVGYGIPVLMPFINLVPIREIFICGFLISQVFKKRL